MTPRTALYVARVHLAIVALVVVAGLIGGVALQLELWKPGPAWSAGHYSRMLGVHGFLSLAIAVPVMAGCFGYVAIAELVGARRVIAPAVAWIGLALWVIGVGTVIVTFARRGDDTGWTLYTPYSAESSPSIVAGVLGPLALATAGLVFAIHLGVMIAAAIRTAHRMQLVVAAAFALAVGGASVGWLVEMIAILSSEYGSTGLAIAPSGKHVLGATVFAALVLATAALARDVTRGPHAQLALVAVGCAAGWAFTPLHTFGLGLIGVWIALAVLGRLSRPVVAIVVFGIAPAIVTYAFTRVLSNAPDDLPVHDTYFQVGEHHLIGTIIAFAGLAALCTWSHALVRRTPQALVTWLGAIVCSTGMLLHVYASLRIGGLGMPRRYWDYDPTFAAGHGLAGVGAAIVIAGLAVLAVAWVLGRDDQKRP